MDADGSHRPEQLPKLLARAAAPDQPDLVIGSRWVRGGSVVGWAKHRELLSRAGNLYIGIALGLGVNDATAGFRVYKTASLPKLHLDAVDSAGYCFQIDLTRRARRAGLPRCRSRSTNARWASRRCRAASSPRRWAR